MILILGLALTGVAEAVGLPAFPTVGVEIFVSIDTLGVDCGPGDAVPGSGLRPTSPEGSGFLALAVMLSLEPGGEGSLGAPVGRAVLALGGDGLGSPRITASRLGLAVLSVTTRLFLEPLSPVAADDSIFVRFGTGVPFSFSGLGRLGTAGVGVAIPARSAFAVLPLATALDAATIVSLPLLEAEGGAATGPGAALGR
jgi:hypothetical protein